MRAGGSRREYTLSSGLTLTGVVVEPDGTPIVGANLRLQGEGNRSKWVMTDDKGAFAFKGLTAGALEIQVQSTPGGHVRGDPLAVTAGVDGIRIVLKPGHEIAGTVIGADGKPGQRVMIEALGEDGKTIASARVDRDKGEFTVKGLEKGSYTLRVRWWMFVAVGDQVGTAIGSRPY